MLPFAPFVPFQLFILFGSFLSFLQVCITRIIGSIPGPIAFGFFLDQTCVLWDQDCGDFYNDNKIKIFFYKAFFLSGRHCMPGI